MLNADGSVRVPYTDAGVAAAPDGPDADTDPDNAASGSLATRAGMQAMLPCLRRHRTKGPLVVIIDDISRLARGMPTERRPGEKGCA